MTKLQSILCVIFILVLRFDIIWSQVELRMIFKQGKYGFIDKSGTIIIKPKYDFVSEQFHDGLVAFSIKNKHGYLNSKGRIAFTSPFALYNFHEGFAPFFNGSKLGFYSSDGGIAFFPKFKNYILGSALTPSGVPSFSEGLAAVVITRKDSSNWYNFIYINKKGVNEYGDSTFAYAGDFSESFAFVRKNNGECGYINHEGILVLKLHKGDYGERFSEGFAAVCDTSLNWRFINKYGEYINDTSYENVEAFSDGLAKIKLNGKWGFIDSTGHMIIDPKYSDNTYKFSEGLAPVSINNSKMNSKTYIINRKGQIVLGPYENVIIKEFINGLAEVINHRSDSCTEYSYINKLGMTVWSNFTCHSQ